MSRVTLETDSLSVTGGRRLFLGSATTFCADAPVRTSGHPPGTAQYDRVDRFKAAAKVPAPLACPQLPVAG